ncbi:MAG: hypothetical protein WC107_06630 [Patescibacteria group bacterium]
MAAQTQQQNPIESLCKRLARIVENYRKQWRQAVRETGLKLEIPVFSSPETEAIWVISALVLDGGSVRLQEFIWILQKEVDQTIAQLENAVEYLEGRYIPRPIEEFINRLAQIAAGDRWHEVLFKLDLRESSIFFVEGYAHFRATSLFNYMAGEKEGIVRLLSAANQAEPSVQFSPLLVEKVLDQVSRK